MKLSSLGDLRDPAGIAAVGEAAITLSDTPPMRLVWSAAKARPVTEASRTTSRDGQRREPAQVDDPTIQAPSANGRD